MCRVASEGDDKHPLRQKNRPQFEEGKDAFRVADLFCGCGGLTLGIAQAVNKHGHALEVALALDFDEDALEVYRSNFQKAATSSLPIQEVLDGKIGYAETRREAALKKEIGHLHALVGGPPCQGHSDLNNHTRRDDPKNELYMRMVRAAEILKPEAVFIENVPTVRHSKSGIVKRALGALARSGYDVEDRVISVEQFGVPQRRRRHVVLAIKAPPFTARRIIDEVLALPTVAHDLKWAIGDLVDSPGRTIFDQAPVPSKDNSRRMRWMLTNEKYDLPNRLRPPCHQDDHSYKAMYGRLKWDAPAQTITSGFGSIGQGRYMHPELPRALTAHEAARLQGFADYFDFSTVVRRASLATMIGNAVPPALAMAIFDVLLPALPKLSDRGAPPE